MLQPCRALSSLTQFELAERQGWIRAIHGAHRYAAGYRRSKFAILQICRTLGLECFNYQPK